MSEILEDPDKAIQLLIDVAEHVRPRPLSEEDPYPKAQSQEEALTQVAEFAGCLLYDVEGGVTVGVETVTA